MENTTVTTPATPPANNSGQPDPKATQDQKANANGSQAGAGGQATGAAAVKAATEAAIRKYKVVDDQGEREVPFEDLLREHKAKVMMEGQEVEVPYEELLKGYQARQVSAKRFEEAARIQKNAQRFIQLLRQNPAAVLQQLQIDPIQFAKAQIRRQIELEGMTPEQRKAMELENQLRMEQERREDLERRIQEEQEAELRSHFQTDYTKSIIGGLESQGLPKTEWCVKQMAFYLYKGLERGLKLDPSKVATLVKEDLQNHMKQLYGAMPETDLLKVVGEDFAAKIRKADMSRLSAPAGTTPTPPAGGQTPPPSKEPPKKLTMEEWKERNRRILEGQE